MTKKEQFGELMVDLARHYRPPDGELTSKFISDYWNFLGSYSIELLTAGCQEIKDTKTDTWFPLIPEIKKAIFKVSDNAPTKRLPPPKKDEVTKWDLLDKKLNWNWFNLYFGYQFKREITFTMDEVLLYGVPGLDSRMLKVATGKFIRPTNLCLEVESSTISNRKRRAYVQSMTPPESPYKKRQGVINV